MKLNDVSLVELDRYEAIIQRGFDTVIEVGNALAAIRDGKLYRHNYTTFEAYCQDRWGIKRQRAYELMDTAYVAANLSEISDKIEAREAHLAPLTKLSPAQQREVWVEVMATVQGGKITAAHVQSVVDEYKETMAIAGESSSVKNGIGLAEWEALTAEERASTLSLVEGDGKFNDQNDDNIEWALWSWNPITGCLHDCPYCFARDIANHRYTQFPIGERFDPHFYPERLSMPANTKVPDLTKISDPIERIARRNVFTCSMADLFGKWVPTEWIEAVLQQIADNPQWTFLLLTKFPIRMAEFDFPPNTWIGTTVDRQWAVERAEKAFRKIRAGGYQGVAWLSCEPMMERLTFSSLDMFDWVVMGGSSESTQTPEFRPPFEWIVHLENQAKSLDLPVYMKTNLLERVREYPPMRGFGEVAQITARGVRLGNPLAAR